MFNSALFHRLQLFATLARWDKPIGVYLLLWPCWWGIAYAGYAQGSEITAILNLFLLFTLGAVAMRGAGCTLNDWLDKELDAQVERTKNRPLASGQLSGAAAFWFFGLQCLVGAFVLAMLPLRCWVLGAAALALLFLYPFMKRFTDWPQLILGLAFNSGVWIGYAAIAPITAEMLVPLGMLYGAGICWTLSYDTIYALADLPDDRKAGNRSTAILWGQFVKEGITIFLIAAFALWGLFGRTINADLSFWGSFVTAFLWGTWITCQLYKLQKDTPFSAFIQLFKAHHWIGLLLAIGLLSLP